MSQLKTSTKKMLAPVLSLVSIIAFSLTFTFSNSGCTSQTNGTTIDTAAIMAIKCADCPARTVSTGVRDFYHFKIDSAVLVDSFLRKTSSPPFKKIIFNYKVTDYANFPASLLLVGHGAKNNDELIDFNPEELVRLTNKEEINTNNLLYSTMEFSLTKIRNLIGDPLSTNPAQRKSFTHLVFVPDITTQNGQRHLTYKVQKRPIDPNADEPTEMLNPCPPFRPE